MRLTTRGRVAVAAMIEVALHHKAGPLALAEIARRQQISISYLELMFSDLRRHGLVTSTRGPGGGYTLGRAPTDITVADIVFSVDHQKSEPRRSDAEDGAPNAQRCLTPELWTSLSQRVVEFLDSISLKTLVEQQVAGGVPLERETVRRPAPLKTKAKPSRPKAPNSVFELGSFLAGRSAQAKT